MNRFLKSVTAKIPWKEILALLILLLAVLFFRGERKELSAIIPEVKRAGVSSLTILLTLSAAIIVLQGGMYRYSFAATGHTLSWFSAIELFLKRNFLGVFLPAGSVSALAYSPTDFEIHLTDIFGGNKKRNMDVAAEINRIQHSKTIILAGADEKSDYAKNTGSRRYIYKELPGGHHYGDDTKTLATSIIGSLH